LSSIGNVEFWKEEYNRPGNNAVCQHTWQGRGTKYIYQIKHIYGETTGAAAKKSRPCIAFTGRLTPKMNGGCPFVHLSADRLRVSVPRELLSSASHVLQLASDGHPNRACSAYLKLQLASGKIPPTILSPIQYYNLATR